jgi:DtxR family Mn-dependent transcriptional regulator
LTKLDEYLDFPKFDPHGDPIPDTNGKMETGKQISLQELPLNKTCPDLLYRQSIRVITGTFE